MTRTYTPPQIADGLLAGDFIRETEFALAFEIERLRAFEAAHKQLQAALDSAIRERDEARAEIERLHQAHQAACEGGDLLREEVERLREALRDIERGDYSDPMCERTPEQRARDALEAKP